MGRYYPSAEDAAEMVNDARAMQMSDEEATRKLLDCAHSFSRVLMGGLSYGRPSRSRWELAAEIDEAIRIVKRSMSTRDDRDMDS